VAQRIDKWLVYARFVKHRAKAQTLVEQGHVRINRERICKTSHAVKPNDILTLAISGEVRVVRVLAEAERRGPPADAAGLYETVAENPSATDGRLNSIDHRQVAVEI
jgi:ribosome-associated heat shock protein Hsp15